MQRIITPMPPELIKAIDDYRFKNQIPSRSEAIRQLLKQTLEFQRNKKRILKQALEFHRNKGQGL